MIGAVDIGGTKIAVGIVDESGRVRAQTQAPTDPNDYSTGLQLIVSMLRETVQKAGVELSGIGIGSTGPVDPLKGEFGDVDFLPGWRGRNPTEDLAQIFRLRVALENDGDAAALAEAGWGAGRNRSRLIYVTVGTGIGGGMVFDGKLYRGVDGAHPEVGHQVIDPAGPPCSCGFRGCWESLAAGPAMVAWIQTHAPADYPHREGMTAKKICELAQQGDPIAKQAVEHEAYYLGIGLANLINLFTPDAIVLSGSVMKSAPLFLARIREVIGSGCRFVPAEKTQLTLASLGDDTNLIGAARVWHYRFGEQPYRPAV
jgi:glucokinase